MENTPKNFALQLGSLVALYVSVTSLLVLLFGIITLSFPDVADSYWVYENATQSIRFSIAVLIVFFPTYAILTRRVNTVRRKEHGTYLTLTKWLIYLSLLVGGAVLLGDLVAVINGFLNGELTTRFILKALAMLVVVGAAFSYYLLDARGHWQDHEKESVYYGIGALVVVIIALLFGYQNIEAPSEVREMKIDDEQIQDLSDIQWRIEEHYLLSSALPETVAELYAQTGIEVPTASEERTPYQYSIVNDHTFELCAEFKHSSKEGNTLYDEYSTVRPVVSIEKGIINPNNWDHGVGEWCFERVISNTTSSEEKLN